jgi:hypothetical protein
MAAPNIISATTIVGKTAGVILTTTSATAVVSNAASSGKCLKINTLNVANTTGTLTNITVSFYSGAGATGTEYKLIVAPIPANSTLNIIDKSSQYYLEENTSIGATAGTANTFTITCSYEDIS